MFYWIFIQLYVDRHLKDQCVLIVNADSFQLLVHAYCCAMVFIMHQKC